MVQRTNRLEIFFKIAIIISVLTTVVPADCPITANPEVIFDCLGFITRGLYGALVNGKAK
jgi:hypothetical protein